MANDAIGAIKEAQRNYRKGATLMCTLGGVTPPETEKEWLLFGLNQSLRNQGIGKPLTWNPPSHDEQVEAMAAAAR